MSRLTGWYVAVALPRKVVYAVKCAGWNMDVIVVVGSKDLVLSTLVEISAMLLDVWCENLYAYVRWWLCNF